MKKIIILNKKEGETPLECLEHFRSKNKSYKDVKMTYAGRLDPMASGLLIVLAGDEVHKKEKYLGLPKEYNFQILFGFDTDSYDILGKVKRQKDSLNKSEIEKKIIGNIKYFTGKFIQRYPVYSSRTVNGKPLFEYARRGIKLEAPEREVQVKSLKFIKIKAVNARALLKNIQKRIPRVKGDFRQKEILNIWKKKLTLGRSHMGEAKNNNQFFIADFSIKCGSGTYVRGIAHDLGEKMSIPALAYSIKRTRIGKWQHSE